MQDYPLDKNPALAKLIAVADPDYTHDTAMIALHDTNQMILYNWDSDARYYYVLVTNGKNQGGLNAITAPPKNGAAIPHYTIPKKSAVIQLGTKHNNPTPAIVHLRGELAQ